MPATPSGGHDLFSLHHLKNSCAGQEQSKNNESSDEGIGGAHARRLYCNSRYDMASETASKEFSHGRGLGDAPVGHALERSALGAELTRRPRSACQRR
jgi:hypothetical protein